jgi:hypothetical protein
LYSRWRTGQVDSCGKYPRHLGYLASNLPCRFCLSPNESPIHLLSLCPGTLSYRCNHGLSLNSLRTDSPHDIVSIAKFDAWISKTLPFDSYPPIATLLNESLDQHLALSTSTSADLVSSSAGSNVKPPPPRKRPLLIRSSWSKAPGPPTRHKTS